MNYSWHAKNTRVHHPECWLPHQLACYNTATIWSSHAVLLYMIRWVDNLQALILVSSANRKGIEDSHLMFLHEQYNAKFQIQCVHYWPMYTIELCGRYAMNHHLFTVDKWFQITNKIQCISSQLSSYFQVCAHIWAQDCLWHHFSSYWI